MTATSLSPQDGHCSHSVSPGQEHQPTCMQHLSMLRVIPPHSSEMLRKEALVPNHWGQILARLISCGLTLAKSLRSLASDFFIYIKGIKMVMGGKWPRWLKLHLLSTVPHSKYMHKIRPSVAPGPAFALLLSIRCPWKCVHLPLSSLPDESDLQLRC